MVCNQSTNLTSQSSQSPVWDLRHHKWLCIRVKTAFRGPKGTHLSPDLVCMELDRGSHYIVIMWDAMTGEKLSPEAVKIDFFLNSNWKGYVLERNWVFLLFLGPDGVKAILSITIQYFWASVYFWWFHCWSDFLQFKIRVQPDRHIPVHYILTHLCSNH